MTLVAEPYCFTNGGAGSSDGTFATAQIGPNCDGLVWGPDGNMYVTDSAAGKVKKCDPVADTVTSWSPPVVVYRGPENLAVDPTGFLLVGGDGTQDQIFKIDAAGNPVALISGGANQVDSPNVHPIDGLCYLTFSLVHLNRIALDGTGHVTVAASIFTQAEGMAVAPNGDLWVADYGAESLVRVTYGTWATTTVLAGLGVNQGVAVDAAGLVYVGDANNDRILVYDPATTLSEVYATGTPGPRALAFGPDGRLYVADAEAQMVLVCVEAAQIGLGYLSFGAP